MKRFTPLLLLATLGLPMIKQAVAEGEKPFGGAYGVNRVIRTPAGYRAVYGNYDLEFEMPTNEDGLFETLARRNAVVNGASVLPQIDPLLDIVNKPSMYIGGEFIGANTTGSSQIDGGLQLEFCTIRTDSTTYSDPGWSVFFYINNASFINAAGNPETYSFTRSDGTVTHRIELNPRVIDPAHPSPRGVPWRGGEGNINGAMEMEATVGGRARFKCDSLPGTGELWVTRSRLEDATHPIPDYWKVSNTTPAENVAPRKIDSPAYEQGSSALIVFDTSRYGNFATVKRVTAMTRDSSHKSELDGSWLRGTWTACDVFKVTTPGNPGARKNWEASDVNQDVTGYDAPGGTVDLAFDRRYKGLRTTYSRTIVGFAPIDVTVGGVTTTFSNAALRAEMATPLRYRNETVYINLGTLARPVGEDLQ